MNKIIVFLLLMALLWPANGRALHSRDEVRAAYRAISDWHTGTPYAELPQTAAPYAAGALDEAACRDALNYLNFIRWLAGLDPVEESLIYDYQCQRAAVLLAALDYADHNAPMPADMDKNFYDSAHLGTSSGNIARFNWMRDSILREGVAYFARDDGDANLGMLGHRRWALNPAMADTGFGLANSASGMSYVVMYAHDLGNAEADWDYVGWPAAGAFPAELMHDHLAWSVSLNPERYDFAASVPRVTLAEPALDLRFEFTPMTGEGNGFCAVNLEGYGSGGCLIFRPDFEGTGFTDYQQNQHWTARIEGLVTLEGLETAIEYTCDMVSLRAEDAVNIELSQLEATLRPGDALQLSASVIPSYADDLSVEWATTDAGVATVDGWGRVTAVAPGECEIMCRDCAGHIDACRVTVRD